MPRHQLRGHREDIYGDISDDTSLGISVNYHYDAPDQLSRADVVSSDTSSLEKLFVDCLLLDIDPQLSLTGPKIV